MLVAAKLALFATFSEAAAALVSAPPELNTSVVAVLAPASCVDEFSVIDTALPTKVRLPKLTGAVLPSVMFALPALKLALPPTLMAPLFAIAPALLTERLPMPPSLTPAIVSGAVFVKLMLPLAALLALKLLIAL